MLITDIISIKLSENINKLHNSATIEQPNKPIYINSKNKNNNNQIYFNTEYKIR